MSNSCASWEMKIRNYSACFSGVAKIFAFSAFFSGFETFIFLYSDHAR
jgi:hypothetical protein